MFALVELVFAPPISGETGHGEPLNGLTKSTDQPRPRRSDQELIEEIRRGNRSVFTEVVRDITAALHAYAYQYVRSVDVSRDVVQDVFTHLWEQRETLNIQHGTLKQYLFVATRFRAFKLLRRSRVEAKHLPSVTLPRHDPPIDETIERVERFAAVVGAIQQLPPRQEQIVRLRWIEGMTNAEVARHLGISVKGVEIQLTRALAALRKHFQE